MGYDKTRMGGEENQRKKLQSMHREVENHRIQEREQINKQKELNYL